MKRILFVQPYASQVGGVDSVLLQLIAGLDSASYRPYVLLSAPSPYVEKYEKLGCTVLFGPLAVFGKPTDAAYYFRNFLALLRSIRRIRRIAKEFRIDLIHSHKMELIGPNLAGRLLRLPTVQTVHELPQRPMAAYKFVAWLNHLFNDRVIVLCEKSKTMFRWFGRPSGKLVKIYNGIAAAARAEPGEAPSPALRSRLGLAPSDKLIITVARLSPMKGIECLIDAAARLQLSHPHLKFAIVGDVAFEHERSYRANLEARIRSLGLQEQVFMLGLRRDVPELLAQSDALALPSLYDIFPTVLLEAMSAGLPIVASDTGGVPEMVREDTGILFPPGDDRALAEALAKLFDSDAAGMGARGRALFHQAFTRERYAQATAGVYEELLAGRKPAKTKDKLERTFS